MEVCMGEREASRALPRHMYGDPALVVERAEIRELGCRLCQAAAVTMMRAFCSESRNPQQKGFPHVGDRCKWFKERDRVLEVKG
jgi:hypothetical protein